ncbi:hypothetical protein, partial [Citrobacter amalonaticus]
SAYYSVSQFIDTLRYLLSQTFSYIHDELQIALFCDQCHILPDDFLFIRRRIHFGTHIVSPWYIGDAACHYRE